MSTRERWRPIPSAPGYEASTRGRIRNAATSHVLRPAVQSRGYLKVNLGRARQCLVHRLVCEAFHGPAPADVDQHADHLNFVKTDNRPENLRWLPAHMNTGRQARWGVRGWEVEDEPEYAHEPMDDAERADLDAALTANGW